jgi:SEC-C motif
MKIGRNDPCHCGSGQKYKKCHLPTDDAARSAELAAAAAVAAEAQAKADAEAEAEKKDEEKAAAAGDRPPVVRPKDAGASKPRTPAPTQAPAFRRKSV